jgi:ABC-type phosphate/phosphonate transport system substrate-binding protein
MSARAADFDSTRIAALPMYDFPELREAHDLLWTALAQKLLESGVAHVPQHLVRGLSHREIWRHPGLLFGQACEYPLSKSLPERLRFVARPRYSALGCDGTSHRSALVVRATDSVDSLDGLRSLRCVVNEPDSNSGMNLFRAALAPVACGTRFFKSVHFSGSHRRSLELVVRDDADVTAVDCVTLAHVQRLQPALASKVKIIDWTPPSPCLPFVTSRASSEATLEALRAAITDVFCDRTLAPARELLLLEGVDLNPDATLGRVLELEREAEEWRYPALL